MFVKEWIMPAKRDGHMEAPMTRDEAIRKVSIARRQTDGSAALVDGLIALGLLKCEEGSGGISYGRDKDGNFHPSAAAALRAVASEIDAGKCPFDRITFHFP